MSLNEHLRGRSSPPKGIPRSKSFTGVLGHKRSGSSVSAEGCPPEADVGTRTTWGPSLGQAFQSPGLFRRHFSLPGHSKLTKTPRPLRAGLIFEKVAKGLRECIAVTEDDIHNLKASSERLSSQAQQQLKAAERYVKRLEYQLSKLEELHDQYNVQQKLREGMRTMAYAYVSSPGRERDSALNSVKSSYRECTEKLCFIEAQIEQMMGTLQFQMKGIQGFARLCSGDVFEITIKHSAQKWKTRGRILKNGQQSWDAPIAIFKALLGEVLYIKATEVKGLGKTILLGNKFCETRELFCPHPQIMTVNLNPSGSLKLNVVITWNPLDGTIDDVMRPQSNTSNLPLNTKQQPSNTPIPSRVNAFVSPVNKQSSIYTELNNKYSEIENFEPGLNESLPTYEDTKCHENDHIQERHIQMPPPPPPLYTSEDSANLLRSDSTECCSLDMGGSSHENSYDNISLLEAVHNFGSCLEDIQGQYPELHNLEQQISELENLLGVKDDTYYTSHPKSNRRGSQSSDISTSIESVLECFDFLNMELDDEDEEDENKDNAEFTESEKDLDPVMTAKTSDSGIASLTHHTDNEQLPDCDSLGRGKSPQSPITGSDQLDLALVIHLSYCQHLVETLGSFGPLKCKEVFALEKLKQQTPILERLVYLVKAVKDQKKSVSGIEELKNNKQLQQLWKHCSENSSLLCLAAGQMFQKLIEPCQQQLNNRQPPIVATVVKLLICRILDMSRFDPEALVTVYQFKNYFVSENQMNFETNLEDLSEEVYLNNILQSQNQTLILNTIQQLSKTLPPPECLRALCQLLILGHPDIQECVKSYLQNVSCKPSKRKQVVIVYTEALESENSLVRQGACMALMFLKATDCIDQLAYLCQTDDCINVRNISKEVLMSLGDEGRRAYEQSQMSGLFHGLGVK